MALCCSFDHFVAKPSVCRVLSLLNISMVGASVPPIIEEGTATNLGGSTDNVEAGVAGGSLQSPAYLSVPHTVAVVDSNRAVIKGIKIAMSQSEAASFPGGVEAGEAAFYAAVSTTACKRLFSRGRVAHTDGAVFQALEASAQAGVPLMSALHRLPSSLAALCQACIDVNGIECVAAHHTMSTVPLEDCPGNLRPGVSRNLPSIPARWPFRASLPPRALPPRALSE